MDATVVIPVYNDEGYLQKTLSSLIDQDYSSGEYDVIVVDNGSTDRSAGVAKSFDGVTVLQETEHLSSPYSARNRGIEAASGSLIALLDATCVPASVWLKEGVECVADPSVDLVAGHVEFSFSESPTAGEFLDSMTNIRMQDSVRQRGVAKTANLFVPRRLFETLGLFPEGRRSGGDVQWTGRATRKGYTLGFCEGAVVRKPARSLSALVKKQWRVGRGKSSMNEKEHGRLYKVARSFKPPRPKNVISMVESSKYQRPDNIEIDTNILAVWVCYYIVRFVGRISKST